MTFESCYNFSRSNWKQPYWPLTWFLFWNPQIWKNIYVCISACSRDSRPQDWSRLGSIFLVSVSPIISRDSRDCRQLYLLVLDLLKALNATSIREDFAASQIYLDLKFNILRRPQNFAKSPPYCLYVVCTVDKSKVEI